MEVITQEKIDEMKAKLALLENDRKAYCESAMHAISENKKRVAELRSENNKLRNILREGLAAEDHIINHVFHNRQSDRACLANKKGSEAITLMDYRTCDAMKKYNALRHTTSQKVERIEALKRQYRELQQAIDDENATTAGTNKEGKRLRELENRLDKAQLKYQEAEHIKRTYLQIRDKLQEEELTHGQTLDALEKQITTANDELNEVQLMYNDAVLSRDVAQRELKYQEEVGLNERRRREAELASMKKIAEGRKSSKDKGRNLEARNSMAEDVQDDSDGRSGENSGDRISPIAGVSEEQQQKIAAYEEAFKSIKEVTGLSDLAQIVKRFENQVETFNHLEELKETAEKQCRALREERDHLQEQFAEMKYSGETELTSTTQLLEQYKKEAEQETQRREEVHQSLSDASRLLIQCKAGVDHIHEKLTNLNTSLPFSDRESEEPDANQLPDMLRRCIQRLDELLDNLQDVDIDEHLSMMKQEDNSELYNGSDFFIKLEGKIPEHNTRIKIQTILRESMHEDEDTVGEENDILTRNALKKQSQQIVELRNKKRQGRKKKRRAR